MFVCFIGLMHINITKKLDLITAFQKQIIYVLVNKL